MRRRYLGNDEVYFLEKITKYEQAHKLLSGYKYVSILAVGGGGAGGSGLNNEQDGSISGGGGGGGVMRYLLNLDIKVHFPALTLPYITIGSGGVGNGRSGGATFIYNLITANGGYGGGNAAKYSSGSGGNGGCGGGCGGIYARDNIVGNAGVPFNESLTGSGGTYLIGNSGFRFSSGGAGGSYSNPLLTEIFGGTGLGGVLGDSYSAYKGGGGGAGYGNGGGSGTRANNGIGLPGDFGGGGGGGNCVNFGAPAFYGTFSGGPGGNGIVVLCYHNKRIKEK